MKFVEMCSQNRERYNFFYDKMNEQKEFEFDKVEYIGLPCDCIGLKNADPCKHSNAVNDNGVINFYLNILNSNTR